MPTPALADLKFLPYLDDAGLLPDTFAQQIGVYAIFDAAHQLQCVGYSRDVRTSLKQHLTRCPHQCHWLKVATIERPSRTLLETMQQAWIDEYGAIPPGNNGARGRWMEPIDAKVQMTASEQATYAAAADQGEQAKCLKQVARRVEAELQQQLQERGVKEPVRFDPKLKEQGLLNLKP